MRKTEKLEIRNVRNKVLEIQNKKKLSKPVTNRGGLWSLIFLIEFRICFGFRTSDFGFRVPRIQA